MAEVAAKLPAHFRDSQARQPGLAQPGLGGPAEPSNSLTGRAYKMLPLPNSAGSASALRPARCTDLRSTALLPSFPRQLLDDGLRHATDAQARISALRAACAKGLDIKPLIVITTGCMPEGPAKAFLGSLSGRWALAGSQQQQRRPARARFAWHTGPAPGNSGNSGGGGQRPRAQQQGPRRSRKLTAQLTAWRALPPPRLLQRCGLLCSGW